MAIPNETISMHHVGDVQEDIAMGMNAEDFKYLADVLNGLYSDVIKAPVQEYSTNAWDSHVSAGVTRPIEITLPTIDRLEFIVQDFGLGMSVDDLRNTYSMYGRSDKRDSNAVAGQLGLGSKSGLSYADAFTVTAVKGGVKTIAMVTKDDHGLGVIKILDTAGTDEGNGVRVTIPVDRYDVDDFRTAATNLFRFWEPNTVLIDGKAPATPEWAISGLSLDEHTMVVRSDAGLYRSYVIMGNVAYPVPDAEVGRSSRRFVARLNIGDVDFTPSREEVKHTRHTDATLADLHAYIATTFPRALSTALASATTRWEETQTRVLWAGKGLTLRTDSNPIWTYDPSVTWGRKAQSHLKYSISDIASPRTVVVTGFGAKNLSATARVRLVEFTGSNSSRFVLLPVGTSNTALLDGRPNTFTWDEIVGATVKPKAPKGSRAPKVETVYNIVGGPGMTVHELAEVKGKVLYLNSGGNASRGTLGCTVVALYSDNQLPRVQRHVPGIIAYYDEVEAQRKAALRAITPMDRRIAQARTLPSTFSNLDPAKVADPELAEAIRLSKAADTATMTRAHEMGVSVTFDPLTDFAKRYVLVGNGGYYSTHNDGLNSERLFYINARYNANRAAAFTQALTHGAVA